MNQTPDPSRQADTQAPIRPLTLVVLAAGIGSRYGGLKQIEPVGSGGEAVLDYAVFDARRAGFARFVFVIRPDIEADFRDAISRRFERQLDVSYAFQELNRLPAGRSAPADRKKPWGTGHAVLCAASQVPGPFAVINADDFYGAESYQVLARFLEGLGDSRTAHGELESDGRSAGFQTDFAVPDSPQSRQHAGAPTDRFLDPSPTRTEAGRDVYAMVGFQLDRTLSEHGAVARGLCVTDGQSHLVSIEELTAIQRYPEGLQNREADGTFRPLTGRETVSLNLWGFPTSIFGRLEFLFDTFLQANQTSGTAEFYLPTAVNALLREGQAVVRVLPTPCQWHGVTYREDRPRLVRKIQELVRDGIYPDRLWA